MALLEGNSAVVAPAEEYRTIIRDGKPHLTRWQAYADGYQGYVPIGARYIGNGEISYGNTGRPTLRKRAPGEERDTDLARLNGATGEAELGRSSSFGLQQGSRQKPTPTPTPQNPYPGFDKGKFDVIDKALKKGDELLKKSDCRNGLAQAGINVTDLIKAFNNLKARPDSATSSQGYNILYAEKSTDPQVQQFLQTEKGKGAGGFIYGQSVMLRDPFFGASGAAKITPDISRAIALIHEAVHLTGLGDAFFKGSAKLNDVIIHACWNKVYGHNDLTFIVN